jgi:hypothetical protein
MEGSLQVIPRIQAGLTQACKVWAADLFLCNTFSHLKDIIRYGGLPRWASSIRL